MARMVALKMVAGGMTSELTEQIICSTLPSKAPNASHYLRFNVAHSDNTQVRERFLRLLDS